MIKAQEISIEDLAKITDALAKIKKLIYGKSYDQVKQLLKNMFIDCYNEGSTEEGRYFDCNICCLAVSIYEYQDINSVILGNSIEYYPNNVNGDHQVIWLQEPIILKDNFIN